MYFCEKIKETENRLFEEIKEEILNDKLLLEKIDKEKLRKILDSQAKILKEYINDFKINKQTLNIIKQFYMNTEISFEVVYRILNFIKDKIFLFLKKNKIPKKDLIEFSDYLYNLMNYIAKIYVKRNLYRIKKLNDDIFKEKLLIKVHIDWIEKIILALEKEDPQYFPIININECPFTKYLYYPESLLICLDKRLCTYLDDMHIIIHRLADTLYYHLKEKGWIEAYFVFIDFSTQLKKFINTISDLYYVTYSNPEQNFFKLLEVLAFEKRVYVSMIEFLNYDELTQKYSEETVSKALDVLEKRIYNNGFYADSFLVIKALSSGFYMLNMNLTPSRYKTFVNKIKEIIDKEIDIDGVKLSFKSVIVGAEIDLYKNLKHYDFLNLLIKLEEKAEKEKKEIILLIDEKKEDIDIILDHKYDGQFILNAFDKDNIEIAAQPIFDVKTNKIIALEILGRVKDYNNKLIPMEKFYKQIEKMDLVKSLDLTVGLKMSMKGKLISKVSDTVFINIDFQTLLNKDYINTLKKIKEKYQLEIIFEISDIEYDTKYNILISLYKEYGLQFAIDNFEKQCFSLEVFIKLLMSKAVKYIKISKHLFYDEHYLKMLEMVKYLNDSFNIHVVVKYVENKEIYNKIIKEGFQYVQGFYLKTPRPVEELIIDSDKMIKGL